MQFSETKDKVTPKKLKMRFWQSLMRRLPQFPPNGGNLTRKIIRNNEKYTIFHI